MNISLVGRRIELTDAIKTHINNSIQTLSKFNVDIISVTAVASANENKGKYGVSIEFTINLAAKNSIIIKQNDTDLYAAVDIAINRAQKAIRRMHDRDTDHYTVGINEAKAQANGNIHLFKEGEDLEDEIVPLVLDLYKPREVADVLEEIKESDKMFEIFLDHEDKTRVLYKRSDGRFGLY